eukprot:CAMPEP_0170596430 /NCGR_PEP_ID=MMETSP0224-20130122/15114_1 /TAXON_ID=285029 /ORGANISM="Togula jolla, Strain CCCM 725" /LENGTH=599 /DNA_ID=CAMNT_0010920723 /DNA_START=56 /DNA_END=1855 /DNA_ORIENTATION=+
MTYDLLAVVVGGAIFALYRRLSVKVPFREAKGKGKYEEQPQPEPDIYEPVGVEPCPEPSPKSGDCDEPVFLTEQPAGRTRRARLISLIALVALALLCIGLAVALALTSPDGSLEPGLPEAVQASAPVPDSVQEINRRSEQAELAEQGMCFAVEPDAIGNVTLQEASHEPVLVVDLVQQKSPLLRTGEGTYYKSSYLGSLRMGTPSKVHSFLFDTGSGHLIVPSAYCRSDTCRAKRRYWRSASNTAVDLDFDGSVVSADAPRDQLTVSFGTGEVTGVFIEDTICMDWAAAPEDDVFEEQDEAEAVKVISEGPTDCMRMSFIAATAMSDMPFKTFDFDGVLGLGLAALSKAPEFNFLHMMAKSLRSLGSKMPHTFAFFLAEYSNEVSQIALGGWSEERVTGGIFWNPVHSPEQGHWMVRIKSMHVDGVEIAFCKDGCHGVVDTGTSLLAVPPAGFTEVFELMRHPATLEGSCKGPGPRLEIELDTFTLEMDPEDYARPDRYPKSEAPSWYEKPEEQGSLKGPFREDMYCKPMLMALDLPASIAPKIFILGEPLLRKYYTVYDAEHFRIGFGRALHTPDVADEAETDDSEWFWEVEEESQEE